MKAIQLEPDILTPDQWAGNDPFCDVGERRLLLAMLEEAFTRLKYQNTEGRTAYRWLMSDVDQWGAFVFVCELCGLDRWKLRRHGTMIWLGRVKYERQHHRVVSIRNRIERVPDGRKTR